MLWDNTLQAPESAPGTGARANAAQTEKLLFDYVEALKIKRFTEIFYMVYRNMHLIPRHATENAGTVPHNGDTASLSDDPPPKGQRPIIVAQETHVLPVFDSVGYNQSVYTL